MAYDVWQTCMFIPGFNRAECAGWVQAWGSIIAIAVSVWIVDRSHRLELERNRLADSEKRRALLEGAFQLVGAVYMVAKKAVELAAVPHERSDMDVIGLNIELHGVGRALSGVDHLRFDSHPVIEGLITATNSCEHFGDTLDYVIGRNRSDAGDGNKPNHWPTVAAEAEAVMREVRPRMDAIRALLDS